MTRKIVSSEDVTEYSDTISSTDGLSTIYEGTEKPSFREGRDIAVAIASIYDEDGSYFSS